MLVAVGVDWLHLLATVAWVGGLLALAVTAAGAARHEAEAAALPHVPRRFSRLALTCVCVLAATGAYNAYLHVPSLASLAATQYGQVLLAKLGLIAMVLAIARVSRRRVEALTRPGPPGAAGQDWARRLRIPVLLETGLLLVVLALVVWLTSVPPATVAGAAGQFESSAQHGGYVVTLVVHPATVGSNHVVVTIRRSGENTPVTVREVTVFIRPLEVDGGLDTVEPVPGPGGSFTATVVQAFGGRSLVSIQVSPVDGDAFVVEFDVPFST
jgi:copper transport protein